MPESVSFEEELARNGKIAYTNVGVSMRPLIREGRDVMLIEAPISKGFCRWDTVLFRRPGVIGRGAYVLHRILKVLPDGTYWIVGDNCISGEIVSEKDILGTLTQVNRDGKKTIYISDFSYKLYVLFWCKPYHLRFFILRVISFLRKVKRKICGV